MQNDPKIKAFAQINEKMGRIASLLESFSTASAKNKFAFAEDISIHANDLIAKIDAFVRSYKDEEQGLCLSLKEIKQQYEWLTEKDNITSAEEGEIEKFCDRISKATEDMQKVNNGNAVLGAILLLPIIGGWSLYQKISNFFKTKKTKKAKPRP